MTILSVLSEAADEIPDKPLFVFPETRWCSERMLTYAVLATRSGSAAATIGEYARAGERVLLMLPAGPEFWEAFFGCLFVGIIAVPLNIPNLNRSSELLKQVCHDCEPSLLITDLSTADLLARRSEKHPEISELQILTPDLWQAASVNSNRLKVDRNTPAFLQYTSGSTSRPKGIQVSHGNLLANLEMIRDRMSLRTLQDRGVTWLPHYHDMGLVGSYLATLFTKNTSWCLPPEDFALQPANWLRLISEHRADVCGAPDFAYRVCAERITEEQMAGLDLSSWRVAYVGAERIRADTLRDFAARFASCGFRRSSFFPCYGLGEATLLAAGGPADASPVIRHVSAAAMMRNRIERPKSEQDSISLVGSGQTFEGVRILIVSSESGQPVGQDQIGEIFLSGPSVVCGYFNHRDLNEHLFQEFDIDGRRGRFVRTGDLGFIADGQLFITGRTKELVIIRGRNICPEDVEQRIAGAHTALQDGGTVAFSAERNGQESLIIASELQRAAVRTPIPGQITAAIRQRVAEAFGISPAEIVLLRPASIPRTTSGKPRRTAFQEAYCGGNIESIYKD